MSLDRRGQRKSDLKPSLFQCISEPPSRTATQIQILNKLGPAQDQQDSQCPPGITILNALGSLGGSIRRSLAIPHFSGMLVDVSSIIPYLQDTLNLWNQPLSAPSWPVVAVSRQLEIPVSPQGSQSLVLAHTFTQKPITAFEYFWSEPNYIHSKNINCAPIMNYTLWGA